MPEVLLIEDDKKTALRVKEALKGRCELISEEKVEGFLKRLREKPPALALIDFDLKETDGLQVFQAARDLYPQLKAILFSSSGSIPLAVKATKLGAIDFIHKPFSDKAIQSAVEDALKLHAPPLISLKGLNDVAWLAGNSKKIKGFQAALKAAALKLEDIIFIAEPGIEARSIARLLHINGPFSKRKFAELDLKSFMRESSETHFWVTLQELMANPDLSRTLKDQEDLLGTLYIEGLDLLREHFARGIVDFLRKRKSEKRYFKEARIVISSKKVEDFLSSEGFETLSLPALRERKEDILSILNLKFPQIKYYSPKVSNFFIYYDFPGNYDELYNLVRGALYGKEGEVLDLKDLPLDLKAFADSEFNKVVSASDLTLLGIREKFESDLLELVLQKSGGDKAAAARFLEVPKTILVSRIKRLGIEV